MKYVIETLDWRGWTQEADEDGIPCLINREEARNRLREYRRHAVAWNNFARFRTRIVNPTAPMNRKARQERKRRWVTDYRTDRCYGGPEEGGWWFDTGQPVKGTTQSFYSEDRARDYTDERDALSAEFNKARGFRGDISSVACDYALRTFLERHPPRPYPDQTPRYC